jgi:hypothetical protein
MTCLLNSVKIYQLFQKLSVGDTDGDRQYGELIILTFPFLESRLRMKSEASPLPFNGPSQFP